ncbi:BRCA2-interacting transcriptional repressor EMSY-like [Daphnia carinata]|uniref:BRCA2-interacting transcriptional repressor EMSY-like n=1 Tax=Daphnia carinata TaxID=120202 RepID=UPI00257D676F|nr:BRCA2-interacting transcriptional repressor EMSY-like [Daphnia carinata]
MGPTIFDSTKEECHKVLRRMELETYGAVVSTLRAQGELNKDRRKLLEDLSVLMKISPERHKAEIRRAVNDEKLGCIAERLSGGADTEWAWALEGRRVVPLMPRLVRPTLFTSLATSVSKAVAQNPRICLNQTPITNTDEASSKYVRDPDDEDTLSPVMVPIASPDSSCHSNNNFESDFMDTPIEKSILISNTADVEKKPEILSKKTVIPVNPTPVKRPRSPSNQVVNFSAPLPKVRAVSPTCVRPQHKLSTASQPSPQHKIMTAPQPSPQHKVMTTPQLPSQHKVISTPQPSPQLIPRGQQITTPIRPQQHLSNPSSLPVNTGKIRVRAPIVQANAQRPSITVRPPVPQYAQVQLNQARPVTNNAGVKQVVQIRASSLNQQQQTIGSSKETSIPRSVQTHTPVTVQTVPSVASSIGKQLPGKANVIVLHKNLPMAKTITTVARDVDRSGSLNKNNFLPKSVSTPTGTKVTFPNNVRIISVPSGANVVSSGSGIAGVNHATQKIVSTTVTGGTTQKNVYVLELSNEAVGKSIILGDIMSTAAATELNGASVKTPIATVTDTKGAHEAKVDREIRNEILSYEEVNDNGFKFKAADAVTAPLSHNFTPCNVQFPTRENLEKNGEHAVVCATTRLVEDDGGSREVANTTNVETSILDPHTGVIYAITDEQTPQPSLEQSSVDIFSTAIASADINMEAAAYSSDENAGITRLILTDTYDSPSAKS